MPKISCKVLNRSGLHARPAAAVIKLCKLYPETEVFFEKESKKVSAQSMMNLLLLAATCETKLNIYAEGKDAEKILHEINKLFLNKFGEE